MRHRGVHPSVCPLRRKDAVANAQRSVYCSTVLSVEKIPLNVKQRQTFNVRCQHVNGSLFRVPAALLRLRRPLKCFQNPECFQTLYTLRITAIVAINVSIYVHVPRPRGGPRTRRTRCVTHQFDLPPLVSQPRIVDDRQNNNRRNDPVTTSNQPLQGESNFGDSSGPLFSIYTKAAEDEDKKLVERWQKDADGILIFVSPRIVIRLSLVFFTYRPGIP